MLREDAEALKQDVEPLDRVLGSDWTKRYPWIVEAALQIRQKRLLQSDDALKLEKPNCIGSTLPCMKNPMPGSPPVYVGSVPVTIS